MSKPIILIIIKRWRLVSVVSEKSIIFAANMTKNLYIISGCNGAGKTTASKNLFNLFIPVVDYWAIFDNSETPRKKIAIGGKDADTEILYHELYEIIKAYVK
jgi:predicted ABC-type ATPase